jgi:hypothetical protein
MEHSRTWDFLRLFGMFFIHEAEPQPCPTLHAVNPSRRHIVTIGWIGERRCSHLRKKCSGSDLLRLISFIRWNVKLRPRWMLTLSLM